MISDNQISDTLLYLHSKETASTESISRAFGLDYVTTLNLLNVMLQRGLIEKTYGNTSLARPGEIFRITNKGQEFINRPLPKIRSYSRTRNRRIKIDLFLSCFLLLIFWVIFFFIDESDTGEPGNAIPIQYNSTQWKINDSSRLKDSLKIVKNGKVEQLKSLQKHPIGYDSVKTIEHQITRIDSLLAMYAILGYSYPKFIKRRVYKHINAFVTVKNDGDYVMRKLGQRTKMQGSDDDSIVIWKNNVIFYDSIEVTLIDPNNDFTISPIIEGKQRVDKLDGNVWDWTITTETTKETAEVIINILAVQSNITDSLTYARIPISIVLDSDGMGRKVKIYVLDHLGETFIIALLIPIVLLVITKLLENKKNNSSPPVDQSHSTNIRSPEAAGHETDHEGVADRPEEHNSFLLNESRIRIVFDYEGVNYQGWARQIGDDKASAFYHIVLNDNIEGTLFNEHDGWLFDNGNAQKLAFKIGKCIQDHYESDN